MTEKVWLTLQRKADGVWLYIHLGSEIGAIYCGPSRGRLNNDLIDVAVAAGEFIPNPEEVGR